MKALSTPDYIVFLCYFVLIVSYGLWIYYRKKKEATTSNDYFLAEGSLTWWAIGASLIASNISAEQFVAMSGSGFKLGLAIATYEWMAAIVLIIVAVFFIPVYLKNRIFTMPQFLKQRYNGTVAMIMAVFWLALYIVINLTSILYLGALAISSISGFDITLCMVFLGIFSIFITLGGMKVIGYTDVIQVFFLILGGLVTTYLALNLVADEFGGSGVFDGFAFMGEKAGSHFDMIFTKDNPNYNELPGISVLIGGMLITNLYYWGCNQYITQRALGADLKTARSGILFAAFLKLLMPLIVVIPGIAAFVLYQQGHFQTEMMLNGKIHHDSAYPVLLNLLPSGLKGLAFAALTAAIVASLAGKANSIATIFTLDIYKQKIDKDASEKKQVKIGKITVVLSILTAIMIAPFLGIEKGGFKFIQEFSGFLSPGVFAMFLLGFFWKKTTANAAMYSMIGGFVFSVILKFLPGFVDLEPLYSIGFAVVNPDTGLYEIPFLDRMGIVFVLCIVGMFYISRKETGKGDDVNSLEVDTSMFRVERSFLIGAAVLVALVAGLYAYFW